MQTQQEITRLQTTIHELLLEAKNQGASAADAGLSIDNGLSVNVRLGDVETIEHHCSQGLGITVYFGQKKGSANSTDLSEKSIKETVTAACSIARYASDDPYAGLPDPDRLASEFKDLELYHPWDLSPNDAINLALSCEDTARQYHPDISNSEGASVDTYQGIRVFGNSLGFLHGYASTRHSISCSVLGERDGNMERDYWYSVARNHKNLESPELVGKKAAERTVLRLGARSLTTRKAPVLYSAEVASGLISSFLGAISGGSLYRKSSFLLDSLGTKVFPDFINIYEQPHLLGALGSACYDAEGVTTKANKIVTDGILDSYLLSSYSARKLDMQSTGHAGGVHNLCISAGEQDFQQLLKQMDTGLLVTELMGQGVNPVTGDYSRGASGFWVEQGEIQYPVQEITIAGNLKDMFQHILAVGNDIDYRGNIRTGSILIEEMAIAGE
ncbi:PmbA protein [Bathymodiolus platifrons methanotrophic gill symbiont]|uniref:metalloprotease PmbA n=1 Tax=Bathymodiolus platifrons methanotrophic gill symbiont TaxID=113268 RepID=UPI000B41BA6C|nr:metalloprotease PmbA [Bathymodiolus platifrons methanotrophic gill symbiont]TXK96858.1 metalloprotease PmbA [Methylococcaceae bacterium CS4]TXK98713.1 metalloprotease PmbA [Methylococcaceae bacterium CS5]TXL05138.1 metalloprotease PmbA [Methylococcaceae bacterium CS1]TXL07352.1 metalloprotease PmbA [Methylococcaceae bacterium CS3]TXL09911.1 metalloprotease PmbA [Methylococcaceae bacterium CS2]TXL13801.1 metalloprotease PmbA [Methylococcaceae bacterium HT4]TXL19319.1 metalloprotease PmbA [